MSDNVGTNENVASRRAVVGGFVGLGVGVPLLAACGSDSDSDSGSGGSADKASSGGSTTSGTVGTKSEVPVGSGKIFASEKVVVTQPTAGDFKAFSAVCTHQGCVVAKIAAKDIECTCHGSKFSIEDGSVVTGPATKGLEKLKVTVSGDDLSVS